MNISKLGEFGLIEKINKMFQSRLPAGLVGIGDDCAVIPQSKSKSILISTDLLIENIHFLRTRISPQDLGYKSIAVNLSDIAAMGGAPKYVFISMAMPANTNYIWLNKYLHAVKSILEKYNVLLLGGDTTGSKHELMISVTVVGEAHPKKIKYRSDAKLGDIICVTRNLGDSAAGLFCIKHNIKAKTLINRHYRPIPEIEAGLFLAEQSEVHAMIDVSDGINSDLRRIMGSSHCGAVIDLNALPISLELIKLAQQQKFSACEMAAMGGEDYCLLATVASSAFDAIATKFKNKFNRPLIPIGRITDGDSLKYFSQGKSISLKMKGFSHF
jgi:thiamine-monophosphate kinase